MTGLPNRRFFEEILEPDAQPIVDCETVGVIYIDLNKFKQVNDEQGHETGDAVLKIVSQRLKNAIRDTDIVCRIGGDEFVFLALNIATQRGLLGLAHKMYATIALPIHYSGQTYQLGASMGIGLYPDDNPDIKALVKLADDRMYDAKKKGICIAESPI